MKTGRRAGFPLPWRTQGSSRKRNAGHAQLAFLNNISNQTAIFQPRLRADARGDRPRDPKDIPIRPQIGIGILDYTTKDIEIRAERPEPLHRRAASGFRWAWEFWGALPGPEKQRWYRAPSRTQRWESLRTRAQSCAFPLAYGETLTRRAQRRKQERECVHTPDDKANSRNFSGFAGHRLAQFVCVPKSCSASRLPMG